MEGKFLGSGEGAQTLSGHGSLQRVLSLALQTEHAGRKLLTCQSWTPRVFVPTPSPSHSPDSGSTEGGTEGRLQYQAQSPSSHSMQLETWETEEVNHYRQEALSAVRT